MESARDTNFAFIVIHVDMNVTRVGDDRKRMAITHNQTRSSSIYSTYRHRVAMLQLRFIV